MNQVQQLFEYLFKSLKIWVIIQPWEEAIRVRNGKSIKKLSKGIYFKITNFAIVKTFRLIQDQSWVSEGFSMNDKK